MALEEDNAAATAAAEEIVAAVMQQMALQQDDSSAKSVAPRFLLALITLDDKSLVWQPWKCAAHSTGKYHPVHVEPLGTKSY